MVSDKLYKRMHLGCSCGHVSRNMAEEARHRHNFPAFCKRKAVQCEGRVKRTGARCQNKTTDGVLCRHHAKG